MVESIRGHEKDVKRRSMQIDSYLLVDRWTDIGVDDKLLVYRIKNTNSELGTGFAIDETKHMWANIVR